ncbi:proteic killer suppression protein [Halospina denitrificans]|uniref:Proteic killer suppression protein n=1 Tax=Halospina denitrificans TaxID=332522 RepID=A0A4R7JYH6_9GAMM|nr:type II toxin-antitoxin system RelE/ParE family toxin [Halospina denitrificans]TDT42994.1 proteic killer suppression protein [Halospina denitrificans]
MIKSFADKTTAALFDDRVIRKVSKPLQRKARRKLVQLDAVERVEELRIPPGNRLEKLSGNRSGQWSMRVDAQWRLCFRFEDGHAWDVEFCDYH